MSYARKILRNVLSNWAGLGVALVISFFMAPFVVHKLGNAFYGIWAIMMQLTGYLGLLELGVRSSVIKYIAQYYAENNSRQLNQIVSSAISFYLVLSVLCLLVTVTLAILFPSIFKVEMDMVPVTRWIVIITGITVAQGLVFNVFFGILMGIQRYDIFNKVSIIFAVIRAILILILLEYGYGIIALGLIQLFISLCSNIIAYVYCRKELPDLEINWFHRNKNAYKMIITYSTISFLIQVSIKLIYYTDAFVIGIFLSTSAITFYAIAGNLIEYLRKLVGRMTQVLNPLTSELSAIKDYAKIREVLIRGTKFSLLLGLPICATYLIMGRRFISLWMGPQYAISSGNVLIILTITHLFSLAQYTTGNILLGISRHKIAAYCHGIEAIFNLILSILLVKSLGIIGVAIGTAVPHLIVVVIIFPIVISRVVGLGFWDYIKQSYIPPFFAAIPFIAGLYIMNILFPAASLLIFFSQIFMLLPLFIVAAWYLSFNKKERAEYQGFFMQVIPILSRR